jgi:hypothetical protein
MLKFATLLAFGFALAYGMGGSSSGSMEMFDDHGPPPETLAACFTEMEEDMAKHMKHMEVEWDSKFSCKSKCMNDDFKACLPPQSFLDEVKKEHEGIKTEFMAAKKKAQDCLTARAAADASKPVKERGCSADEPLGFGPCGMGILKSMMPEEAEECVHNCIKDDLEKAFDDFKGKGKGLLQAIKGKVGAGNRNKRSPMMMFGKGKGKGKGGKDCLHMFCTMDALEECAKSSGLEEAMKDKMKKIMGIEKKMDGLFDIACPCVKAAAEKAGVKLVPELAAAECSALPNKEVCGAVRDSEMAKMKSKMGELINDAMEHGPPFPLPGPPPGMQERRKRELSYLYGHTFETFTADVLA